MLGVLATISLACVVGAWGINYLYTKADKIPRLALDDVLSPPATGGPNQSARTSIASVAENYLIVGSDSRAGVDANAEDAAAFGSAAEVSGQRSDTIMVARLDPDGPGASLVSIPRDLYVPLAGSLSGRTGRINEAYDKGVKDLILTVQQALNIPIHHYIEVDFDGFKSITDALGGVPIYFPTPELDDNSGLNITSSGCATLDGEQALAYVRSRHMKIYDNGRWIADPSSDFGRTARQQGFVQRAGKKALDKTRHNPILLNRLLDVATHDLKLDNRLTTDALVDLTRRYQDLDPAAVDRYSLPVNGFVTSRGADVLQLLNDQAQPILAVFRGEAPPVPPPAPAPTRVEIAERSGRPQLAEIATEILNRAGYDAVVAPAAKTRSTVWRSTVVFAGDQALLARKIAELIPGITLTPAAANASSPSIKLTIGRDLPPLVPPAPQPTAEPSTVPTPIAPTLCP